MILLQDLAMNLELVLVNANVFRRTLPILVHYLKQ